MNNKWLDFSHTYCCWVAFCDQVMPRDQAFSSIPCYRISNKSVIHGDIITPRGSSMEIPVEHDEVHQERLLMNESEIWSDADDVDGRLPFSEWFPSSEGWFYIVRNRSVRRLASILSRYYGDKSHLSTQYFQSTLLSNTLYKGAIMVLISF